MEDILKYKFWSELKQLDFVKKIWLYGSRARKDNFSKSDIDIAIDCSGATKAQWSKVLEVIENADTLLKIDCVRFDELSEEKLKQNIISDSRLIYSRDG